MWVSTACGAVELEGDLGWGKRKLPGKSRMPSQIQGTPGLRHPDDGGSAVSCRVAWVESRSRTAQVTMELEVVRKRGFGLGGAAEALRATALSGGARGDAAGWSLQRSRKSPGMVLPPLSYCQTGKAPG